MMNSSFGIRATALLSLFLSRYSAKNKAILCPANVCTIIPSMLDSIGQSYEFIDVNPVNYCVDQTIVFGLLSLYPDRYAGLIYVRTYGCLNDESSFFERLKICNSDFLIIDDRCLCFPNVNTSIDKNVDLLLYSTGYAKVIDLGYGALAYTNDRFELANIYRFEGKEVSSKDSGRTHVAKILERQNAILEHKKRINEIYDQNISSDFRMNLSTIWRYHVRVENKENVLAAIFNNGLFASSHYVPVSSHAKVSKSLSDCIINLFNDLYFTEEKALKISELINIYSKNDNF